MSGGDQGGRPSVPHHQVRVATDRQRVTAPSTAEPRTITISLDEIPEDLQAFARSTGLSIETLIKGFSLGSKVAVALTRADDKLVVDLEKGKLGERLDSVVTLLGGKRRRRELVALVGFVASAVSAGIMGVWMGVAPQARADAEVAVIAPAIEAKRVAAVAVDRTDLHSAQIAALQESQGELAGAVEKLNGAVTALLARLPEPEPTRIEVPSAIAKPRRKKGIDE